MTNKSRVVPRCHPRAGMRAIMDMDRNELVLVCAEVTAPGHICGNQVAWFKTATYDFSGQEDVESEEAERVDDVEGTLEEAARLTRVGQVRGIALFLVYHSGNTAFRVANIRARDVPPLVLMMTQIADSLGAQWMETVVRTQESLAPSLSAAEEEDE